MLSRSDTERSVAALRPLEGGAIERIEPQDDIALVATVSEGVIDTRGLAAMIFSAVARKGINVEMISAGASEVAIYFIVRRADLASTIQAVHDSAFGRPRND